MSLFQPDIDQEGGGPLTLILGFDIESDWRSDLSRTWIAQWCIASPYRGSSRDRGVTLSSGNLIKTPPDGLFVGSGDEASMYQTQHDIVDHLEAISRGHKSTIVAVHNLNFDLRFLLNAIEQRFEQTDDRKASDGYNITYRNSKIISASLYINGRRIAFHDTSLLHPGTSVASLGTLIGAPKLTSPPFFAGWSRFYQGYEYVKQDAEIVRRVRTMDYKEGMKQATASSYAWKALKRSVNERHCDRFAEHFPVLETSFDALSRMCYVGGFNFSGNPGKHLGKVYHVDINSSYPDKYRNYPLPFGHPGTSPTMPEYGYWEGVVYARLKVKEGCVAWYTPKRLTDLAAENLERDDRGIDNLPVGEGITETLTTIPLTVNSIDWQTLNEDYELHDITHGDVFLRYKTKTGLLRDYCDHLMGEKERLKKAIHNDPGNSLLKIQYEQVKYKLNMPSGRFGLRRETDTATIIEGQIKTEPAEDVTDSYVPFISAICAYGRQQVIRALRSVPPELRYHVDTDSVIAGAMPEVEVSPELGKWDLEVYDGIYEGGMKKYIEVQGERLKLVCAGVPKRTVDGVPVGMQVELLDDPDRIYDPTTLGQEQYRIKSDWLRSLYEDAHMDPDDVDTRKLLPKRVEGGVILVPGTYDLHKGTGYSVKIGRRVVDELNHAKRLYDYLDVEDLTEDMEAYLEDVRYDEKDKYYKRRKKDNIVRSYRKQKLEEMSWQ